MTLPDAPSRDGLWDAVVVGAGPAGSFTALLLARAGASVLLVDRQQLPRWKVCGACLSPGAQAILREAGLGPVLEASGAVPLHELRLAGWGRSATIPLGPSVALSRWHLDDALVKAAQEAGATFAAPVRATLEPLAQGHQVEHRVVALQTDAGLQSVGARVVVAADGLTSPVLTQALGGASSHVSRDSRIGFGGVFAADTAAGYTPGAIHMAVGRAGYVGLVRLEDGRLDVAAALDTAAGRPQELAARILRDAGFPPLPGKPDTGWRGTPALTRHPAALGAERVLAVGDAAGYVEPFTGEGMAWALAGARSLAPLVMEGIRAWHPAVVRDWEEAHAASVGQAARLCRAVAWTLRRPGITRTGLRVLRRFPAAASPVIRHLGRPPATSLASSS